jgi:hypothetical protein
LEDWRKVRGVGVYYVGLEIEKGGSSGPRLNTTPISALKGVMMEGAERDILRGV